MEPIAKASSKVPPLPRRIVMSAIMLLVIPFRRVTFLRERLPYRLRELSKSWDTRMLLTFALSAGKRFYIDQACELPDPPAFEPLVEAPPEFRMTSEQIGNFYRDGFLGPITLFSPEEMAAIRLRLEETIASPSTVYANADGGLALRDRHLDSAELWPIIESPAAVERIAQLLGPDLMLWRSQAFIKQPGAPEITWHQSSVYISEEKVKPVLEPPDRNKLYNLTIWVAVDDSFVENGCMHFLRGTHRKMNTLTRGRGPDQSQWPEIARRISGEGRFVAATDIKLEVDITPEMIVPMPLSAGQCIIFTERCIHGSPPNVSAQRRFGFVYRVCTPDVCVYRGETEHAINSYFKDKFQLKNWGCVMIRGTDTFGRNQMAARRPPAARPTDTRGAECVTSANTAHRHAQA